MINRFAIAITTFVLPLIATLHFTSSAMASDFGSAEEAQKMLERAVEAMNNDEAAALASFTAGTDGFKDRDLYVACFEQGVEDNAGKMTAHGGLPTLVGTLASEIVDQKGTNLGQLLDVDTQGKIEIATYWWPRPGETEAAEKESFFVTVGSHNCLVGYYK